MFDKIEYKLLISGYMTKDEYKNLIDKYMNELNIPYINAQQYIHIKQKNNLSMTIIKNIIKHYWIHIMILLEMVIIYLCYFIYGCS